MPRGRGAEKRRRQRVRDLRDKLLARFPGLKSPIRPLQTGIDRLLVATTGEPRWVVQGVLHHHCTREPYLRAIVDARYRVNLYGQNSERVDAEAKARAQAALDARAGQKARR